MMDVEAAKKTINMLKTKDGLLKDMHNLFIFFSVTDFTKNNDYDTYDDECDFDFIGNYMFVTEYSDERKKGRVISRVVPIPLDQVFTMVME